ncbi:MAG: class I SAM-dependent methyltransferase [Rhodobacteraceae bacterium]|nr:class I SAM-dependent methyltransferase [Paracoccaceae bacterium]
MTDGTMMRDPARFWDKLSTRYAKMPVRDEAAYATTLERTRFFLSPASEVLEVGCGTGTTALSLASAVARYRATDISGGMIEIARAKPADAPVEFAQAGLDDDGRGATYDIVLAFNLLHLIGDLDAALVQIAALVRPGGLFISKTICKPTEPLSWKLRLMLVALPVMQMIGKAPDVQLRPTDTHEDAIERAGFDILERGNYPASPPSRFIVARKRA